jgi:hypothetical protein
MAGERRLKGVERCAAGELGDLRHEPIDNLVHLMLEVTHSILAMNGQ